MQAAYNANPGIGANQLYIKLLKDGGVVSRAQVADFIKRQGDKQIFAARTGGTGHTAPRDESEYMMDLIDLKFMRSGPYKEILVLIQVMTRRVYLKALKTKKPAEVARALAPLLTKAGDVKVISSDAGFEFTNETAKLMDSRGIAHRLKSSGDRNALAVADRAIQTLKTKITKTLTVKNKSRWDTEIGKIEESYNSTSHGHLMGEEPGAVPDVVKFELLQESAENIKKNDESNKAKTDAIEGEQFRAPLPKKLGDRGFKPRYGEVRTAVSTEAGLVKDDKGDTHQIKQVQVVPPGTTPVKAVETRAKALRKPAMQVHATALKAHLGARAMTSTALAKYMRARPGFKEATVGTRFLDFVRLFDEMFKVEGRGPSAKISRVQ